MVADPVIDHLSTYSDLVLKTTPPRVPRHQLVRQRLSLSGADFLDASIVIVQGPPGFGKTSLLGQWRRELLAGGAAVAWVSAEESDDAHRFLRCLVTAVRVGCGRPQFGRLLLENPAFSLNQFEGVTAWLAEVAQTSLNLALIIDEAERLSSRNMAELAYLLHNQPSNLRVIVASRAELDGLVADIADYGQCAVLGTEDLRFRLEETMALVKSRLETAVDADAAARIHEVTEGWPLGMQIMLSAIAQGRDSRATLAAVSLGAGDRREQFVDGLLNNLNEEDRRFLIGISILDLLHPELCAAATGDAQAAERLTRLMRDTPVFVAGDDGSEWIRLHTLIRDSLRQRAAQSSEAEITRLNRNAMGWLAGHGMLKEAARHAYAAGEFEYAYDLAEQCLYEAVNQGYQETVLNWLELLPEAELNRRPRLLLAAAWALALSERHGVAEQLVARLLADPNIDEATRYECALIESGAAYYGDDPDRCIASFAPWESGAPLRDTRMAKRHANRLAMAALVRGDPAQARRFLQSGFQGHYEKQNEYFVRWEGFIVGLSFLNEGQIVMCEEALRPVLASADAELGRRHPLSCMIASLLAWAVYERDQLDEASALLANRLDILEHMGVPETVSLAYRTAARIASAHGVEYRALDLLESLFAVGEGRHLPRLCIVSLLEQIRMHAGRFRAETCKSLVHRLNEILGASVTQMHDKPLWWRSVGWAQTMANAYACIATQDWKQALEHLSQAATQVESLKLGRLRIEVMALRAFVIERQGERGAEASALSILREAINLAHTFGLSRTFLDAHPSLGDWVKRVVEDESRQQLPNDAGKIHIPRSLHLKRPDAVLKAVPSMVLTPKEREVLEFLAKNLSNKEIAQAMEVGEETVKWHLKNLFGKLEAGTRKHAVRRAQLLGLLEDA